jgi:hypothetical protein
MSTPLAEQLSRLTEETTSWSVVCATPLVDQTENRRLKLGLDCPISLAHIDAAIRHSLIAESLLIVKEPCKESLSS